jgi:CHAT domain-containing protein
MTLRRELLGLLVVSLVALTTAAWGAAPPAELTTKQKAKLQEWLNLRRSLPRLLEAREGEKVVATLQRIAALEKEVFGEAHNKVLLTLEFQSRVHFAMAQYDRAIEIRMEIVRLRGRLLGKDHWMTTNARIDLDVARRAKGMTAEQLASAREMDAMQRQVVQLYRSGRSREALPLAEKVLAAQRKLFGESHSFTALGWTNLGAQYSALGQNAKALECYSRATEIWRKVGGIAHPNYARCLKEEGRALHDMGEYSKALPRIVKAADIFYKTVGPHHPEYAGALSDRGRLYQAAGEYAKALPVFTKVIEINKAAVGPEHPSYAASLNQLGLLYLDMREPAKALPLLIDALAIKKKTQGENSMAYTRALNNLAVAYQQLGEPLKALPLLVQASEIRKKLGGPRDLLYANSLNNLADLHRTMGNYKEAVPLFLQAREIYKAAVGIRHLDYATCTNNLAVTYQHMGEIAKGLKAAKEAHDIIKDFVKPDHPAYARSRNNLAALYRANREYARALPLFLQARDTNKAVLGERSPEYAINLCNLADVYQAMSEYEKGAKCALEALEAVEGYLDDGFDQLGERQRNQLLQNALHQLERLLSFQNEKALPMAERYKAALRWKGRVSYHWQLDRLALEEPKLASNVEKLRSARSRLAALALQTPAPAQQADWLRTVRGLTDTKEALEADLARRSTAFRAHRGRLALTPEQLATALPPGHCFIDLIEYNHLVWPKDGAFSPNYERRLLAFVSRRGKDVVAVPLGDVKPITEAVGRWCAEVQKPPTKANRDVIARAATTVRQKVWDRLSKHLGEARTVIVSPDGALCRFPLAALPGSKKDTYLIEEFAIVQVASAWQLFGLLQPAEKETRKGKGLLAVGDIDYGEGKGYGPLPGTGPEANRCCDLFRKAFPDEVATLLSGKKATAAALRKQMENRPRHLHLATHGYFEPPERVERLLRGLPKNVDFKELRLEQLLTLPNLMPLRCGLALAGANQAAPKGSADALPNVLTAQDLEGMDLRGCEVVVLSACQTALGDVERTQGVLGLQRAFHKAGTKTTVTSLWSVHDAATAELMEEFYKHLWGKKKLSRIEALRQAQLAILRDPERVRKRTKALLAELKNRGVPESVLRGIKGRYATDLPDGGEIDTKPARSPEAWWAGFVLSGEWR